MHIADEVHGAVGRHIGLWIGEKNVKRYDRLKRTLLYHRTNCFPDGDNSRRSLPRPSDSKRISGANSYRKRPKKGSATRSTRAPKNVQSKTSKSDDKFQTVNIESVFFSYVVAGAFCSVQQPDSKYLDQDKTEFEPWCGLVRVTGRISPVQTRNPSLRCTAPRPLRVRLNNGV